MFKNPFSFDGRIRRLEFGLTFIIYFVAYLAALFLMQSAGDVGAVMAMIIFLPLIWFVWAQGAKRCHDVGRSGWWQLIPFYFFVLLFQDGDAGRNSHGTNPKQAEQGADILESETLDGHLRA